MKNNLTKRLPDGSLLVAELNDDPNYPGIQISLQKNGATAIDEIICMVEYNTQNPEKKNLCICAYTHAEDEPVYYESYYEPDISKKVK